MVVVVQIVIVDVPPPVMIDGVAVAVAPAGSPPMLMVSLPVKPFRAVVVNV